MSAVVLGALATAFIVYITVGVVLGLRTRDVGDMLPLGFGRQARVASSAEFSASTVATTISLATVVIAFFELAGQFGVWLFWTVLTTSAGLLVVRLLVGRIWRRMAVYDHRPTLHEFLGTEYNSEALRYVGAACTSLGFLAAFAVELTVGSKFFAWLMPDVPQWAAVVVLSIVSFAYTAAGGFRAVIITDRIQMGSIWLLLLALPAYYAYYVWGHGGWSELSQRLPAQTLRFVYRPGLAAFLAGIFIINVPTFISDMSVWQRIAGAQRHETVFGGLARSVISSAATWSLFAILACLSFLLVAGPIEHNPLVNVMAAISDDGSPFAAVVMFLSVLGLYGAMLSTASTQLIAVSHTVYEDIVSRAQRRSLRERMGSRAELLKSRAILVAAALASTALVEVLSRAGFGIADLVFAIYGSQVGLCPLAIAAIILPRRQLAAMSDWAASAVSAGFVIGWAGAAFGVAAGYDDLVFLSPMFSLLVSACLLGLGFVISGAWRKPDVSCPD